MTDPDALLTTLRMQARFCEDQGSTFSAKVLEHVGADIEDGGPFVHLFAPWKGLAVRELFDAAVPLRLLGGLHDLVLSGRPPELASYYPDACGHDTEGLDEVLRSTAEARADFLAEFMRSPPQTNEVRRSICLLGGFLTIAKETGLPLRCLEIGASAGLNQVWDKYRYDLGGAGGWGERASQLRLDTDWSGPAPPVEAHAVVAERAACDCSPIDLSSPEQRRRLEAYVWPDQPDRLARLRAATKLARSFDVTVERADAAAWTKAHAAPRPGVATVLYHSVMWSYLARETQAEVAAAIGEAAEKARCEAPFAWLRMELNPEAPGPFMEIRLSSWPGGEERLLAEAHPHGAWVRWLPN